MQRPIPKESQKFLKSGDFIVSKTNSHGKITYGNEIFIDISGYSEDELLDAPHSILRHHDMPKVVFKYLWDRIQKKEEIFAYVKNLCKDGSYYWVFTNVTTTLNSNGTIRDFHSVRRKASEKALKIIPNIYSQLLTVERDRGIEASQILLEKTLSDKGMTYDQFIFSLQK